MLVTAIRELGQTLRLVRLVLCEMAVFHGSHSGRVLTNLVKVRSVKV